MSYATRDAILNQHQEASMRQNLMNANAPQNLEPLGVHAQIDNIVKELDHLAEEIQAVRDCFGSVLKTEDSCSAVPSQTQGPRNQSPTQLQLMVIVQRILEYRLILRDLRARADL